MHKWRAGKHLGGGNPPGNDWRGNSTWKQIEIVCVEWERQNKWKERVTADCSQCTAALDVFLLRSVKNKCVNKRYFSTFLIKNWCGGRIKWKTKQHIPGEISSLVPFGTSCTQPPMAIPVKKRCLLVVSFLFSRQGLRRRRSCRTLSSRRDSVRQASFITK